MLFVASLATAVAGVWTPADAAGQRYKCIDEKGSVFYSDRPCPVQQPPVMAPAKPPCPLTAEQLQAAVREEEQFLRRYPDAASYRRAQDADLAQQLAQVRSIVQRLAELRSQYLVLVEKGRFYPGGVGMPAALVAGFDANAAKVTAESNLLLYNVDRLRQLEARWHCDLTRFASRWADGAPGSSACAASCASR